MTHRYTLLVGGTVIAGAGRHCTAIAWADDTIIALGTDDEVRAVSRGDSQLVDLRGAVVVPYAEGAGGPVSIDATLEVGGPADLALLSGDPRRVEATAVERIAVVRGGEVVEGRLPGTADED